MINFKRWIPTFLAFPLGGFLAMVVVGSLDGPLTAAAGGLLAGAVIGTGQWLALRTAGVDRRWIAYTAAAMAGGSAVAAVITGAGTELGDLMLAGLVTGAAVGAAQSTLLARTPLVAAGWTAVTAASWALAWLVSQTVLGANADEAFHVFGSSGAVLATVITGLALRTLAAPRALIAPA